MTRSQSRCPLEGAAFIRLPRRVRSSLPRLIDANLAFLVKTAPLQGDAAGFDPLGWYEETGG